MSRYDWMKDPERVRDWLLNKVDIQSIESSAMEWYQTLRDADEFKAERDELRRKIDGAVRCLVGLDIEGDAAISVSMARLQLTGELEAFEDDWPTAPYREDGEGGVWISNEDFELARDGFLAGGQALDAVVRLGHTRHCAKRQAWGDGQCECKPVAKVPR